MMKIHETYDEQHLRTLVAYGNTTDHVLYADEKHTVKLTVDEVSAAFRKGMLLIDDGAALLRPVKLEDGTVTTFDGTSTVAGTEWTAE